MTARGGGAEVVVDHVSRSFEEGRIAALVDVSFRVEPGELVSITGPSGCGKSTLLNLIGALDRPSSGEILVGGERVADLDGARYRGTVVGFVFQFHNLIPTLTAVENVQLPMFGHELGRAARVERARLLLDEVGLSERASAYPRRSPAASASGSRSPERSRTSRGSCWRTSRPARSTPRTASRSSSCSRACARSEGRPCCWSRMIPRSPPARTGPSGSATAASRTLLPPERVDRRQSDRPPGGIERAEQRDAEREREPPGEDAAREVGLGQARERAVLGEEDGRDPAAE